MNDDRDLERLKQWAEEPASLNASEAARRVVDRLSGSPLSRPSARPMTRTTRRWPIAAALALLALGGWWLWGLQGESSPTVERRPTATLADGRSVVVVPLESGSTLFYVPKPRPKSLQGDDDAPTR